MASEKEIKLEERQCWYNGNKTCDCADDRDCKNLLLENMKLLYCNDKECRFNRDLPYEYFVDRGRNHKPFKDDAFTGVCTRKDVGMARQVVHSSMKLGDKQKFTSCRVRADRKAPKPQFPDPDYIQHGQIDDPHEADWTGTAFHA